MEFFASAFVLSMEFSGSAEFWQLLAQLMQAAGRSVYACDEDLARGAHVDDIAEASAPELFSRYGQVFGVFCDIRPGLREMLRHRQKILFLRDPRHLLLARYRDALERSRRAPGLPGSDTAPASFSESLRSAEVARLLQRYRDFVEMWQQDGNVVLLHYEHALAGWDLTAANLVAALRIPIDPLTAAAIAEAAAPLGDRLRPCDEPMDRRQMSDAIELTADEQDELHALCAHTVAALGCQSRVRVPAVPIGPPRAIATGSRPQIRADSPATQPAPAPAPAPEKQEGLYERDPELVIRLRAYGRAEVKVLGRQVIHDADGEGRRPVIGQPPAGKRTLAVFGCSCTYGEAVPAAETFCSVLQGMVPDWRVENHGVPGYGTTCNLVQLERHTRWHQPQYVTFCWIAHHLQRNVADLRWLKQLSEGALRRSMKPGAEKRTRAVIDADGAIRLRQIRMPRSELLGADVSDLIFDQYHADYVCFRLLERASSIVTAYGGHFFVTALLGRPSQTLASRLAAAGIPMVDAIVKGPEYSCLPDDPHPNTLAHQVYAERIRAYLMRQTPETAIET